MERAVVWFRQDLRLADNPALDAAREAERIIPIYIYDENMFTGSAHKVWLHHSLKSLQANLQEKGSRLIIRSGDSAAVLRGFIEEVNADVVFWNRVYEPEAIERDKDLKADFKDAGLHVKSFKGSLLFEPWEVETKSGGPYKVFTPFWKNCLSQDREYTACPEPRELPAVATQYASENIEELQLLPDIPWHKGIEAFWEMGETAAQKKLDTFLSDQVDDYKDRRNTPAVYGTSLLSPHLHFGEISPKQVWLAAQKQSATEGRRVYLSEIGWREFAYHILYHFPETAEKPMDKRFENFPWDNDQKALKAWQKGQTGYPIVDAGMRQLWETGWMHNRVRMIVASFLTKDLLLPWQEGAAWFWDTLVDGDLASNSMGWQWAAGSGADAAPFFRIFNPISQGERFDKDGRYVRRWVPEIAQLPNKYLHKPWEAPPLVLMEADVELGKTYPEPLVDHKEARKAALEAFDTIKK